MRRHLATLVAVVAALILMAGTATADTPTVTVTHGQPVVVSHGVTNDSVFTTFWRHEKVTHVQVVRHRIHRHRLVVRRRQHNRPHPRFRVRHVRITRNVNRLYGMTSNDNAYTYVLAKNGTLTDQTVVLAHGGAGSPDQCGAHPAGSIYHVTPTHWVTFYHAEQAAPGEGCNTDREDKHTRWTIRRMDSWNAGRTWVKGAAVITQDASLLTDPTTGTWNFRCDDAGEPHLTVRGPWMYLTYEACNETQYGRHESIARAPLSTLGRTGTWEKWYDGSFSQPGLGGQQSGLSGIPAGTRGISWNTYLHTYLAVVVHIGGAMLYTSPDLIDWSPLGPVFTTGLSGSAWGHCATSPCPAAYGYGSLIGLNGSPTTTGQSFYLYFMYKPCNDPFAARELERELVTLGS